MKTMGARCLVLFPVLAALMACRGAGSDISAPLSALSAPTKPFTETEPPPAPDYADPASWGCLPDREGDPCDRVPKNSGLADRQKDAAADCFVVYPTTFYRNYGWNARLDDRLTKLIADRGPLRGQFSVFNGSCRIYAPYYRQATLAVFTRFRGDPDQTGALNLAYEDVLAAFSYYLDHYDRGRPIIIAGHSQGVLHAIRLIRDRFEGKDLEKRLVAAYLVGGDLHQTTFSRVPVCQAPEQTGCAVGWQTMEGIFAPPHPADVRQGGKGQRIAWVCVNPLTWQENEEKADASLNQGGVPLTMNRVDPGVTGAQCGDGTLWVQPRRTWGYLKMGPDYHPSDYSLFYLNIRENVERRVRAFTAHRE